MTKQINNSGVRNSFGFYDYGAQEIILKHPCLKKNDVVDVYTWLEEADKLKKISLSIGNSDVTVEDVSSTIYSEARGILRQSLSQSQTLDNEVLKNIMQRLKNKPALRHIAFKSYLFSDDAVMFDLLLQTIRNTPSLVFLDLAGCYFTDEQLIDLAEVIAKSHVAHLVWPEARMSELVMRKVSDKFSYNHSLVVMKGVPLDFQRIAKSNRDYLFSLGRRPTMIGSTEMSLIREYKESVRLAIAFEKQYLFDLEKSTEAVLA